MRDTDRNTFGELMNAIMSFYGKDISPVSLGLWWEALRVYDLVDVRRALNIHATNPDTGQFPPKPADVIRYLQGSTGTQALQAWSKAEKAIRRVGPYQTVVFDDPVIHAVIFDMGGWIDLCNGTEDELPFKAREFERRYQGYALNPPREYPKVLIGIAEAENRLGDFKPPPPVLIGSEGKALACYKAGSNKVSLPVKRFKSITEVLGHDPEQQEVRRLAGKVESNRPDKEPFKSDPERRAQLKAKLEQALQTTEPQA